MQKLSSARFLLVTLFCAGAAFLTSIFCRNYALKPIVPLVFLIVLAPVALIAGRGAALLTAIIASLIFAVYLFEPYGSLAIRSAADQIEFLCFVLAAAGVVHFSPRPLLPSRTTTPSDRLESWIAVVGYAVIFAVSVDLLVFIWNSMRYKQ